MADFDKIEVSATLNIPDATKQIQMDLQQVQANLKPINLDVNINSNNINQVQSQTAQVTKSTQDLNLQLAIVQNRAVGAYGSLQKYLNQNSQVAEKLPSQLSEISTSYQKIQDASSLGEAKSSFQMMNSQITALKGNVRDLGIEGKTWTQGILSDLSKFATWFGVGGLVASLTSDIKQMVTNVEDLSKATVNLQIASGYDNDQMSKLMTTYSQMGQSFGATTAEVADSADAWLRQGKTVDEANQLITDSMELSKLGEINSADSTQYLTSAMKGYGVSVKDASNIVDKLTKVDMESATSAGGLAEAMSKTANAANISGVSMDKLIGMLSTVGEVTQKSMDEVGTSFQAIFSRMGNVKAGKFVKDSEDDVNDVESVLGKLGIKLRDEQGNFRNFGTVIDEVGSKWKSYSNLEQNAVATAIAGTRQRENFLVLMNNYNTALKYQETAENSAGTAAEKMQYYHQGLEAHIKSNTAAFEQFSKVIINSNLFAGVVDTGTSFINVLTTINDKLGVIPTLIASISMGASLLGKNAGILTPFQFTANENGGLDFSSIFTKNTSAIKEDIQALTNYNTAINSGMNSQSAYYTFLSKSSDETVKAAAAAKGGAVDLDQYAKSANSAAKASNLAAIGAKALNVVLNVAVWFAITEAINLASQAIYNFNNKVQIQEQTLQDAVQAYTSAKQKVTDTNTQLDDTNKKITELQSKGTLTFVEQDQYNTLVKSRSELEKDLELEKLIAEQKQKAQTDEAVKTLGDYGNRTRNIQTGNYVSPIESFIDKMDTAARTKYGVNEENESQAITKMIQEYQDLSKATGDHKKQLDSLKSSLVTITQQYKEAADSINPYDDASKKVKNDALNIYNSILKVIDAEQYAKNQTDAFNSVWKADTYKSVVEELNNLSKVGKLTSDTLNGSQFSGFINAMKSAGLSTQDVVNQINALNRSTSNTDNSFNSITSSLTSFGSTLSSISNEITNLGKTFKDLDNAMTSVQEGQSLSGEQIIALLGEYPELAGAIKETSDGYTIELSVLESLRQSKIKEQETAIQAEIDTAQQTLNSTQQRLQMYATEIQGINSVADAKARLASINNNSQASGIAGMRYAEDSTNEKNALQSYIDYHNALDTINTDQTKLKALQTELTIVSHPNYTKAIKGTTAATKEAKSAAEQYKDALENQKDALDQEKKSLQDTYDQMQTDQENIKSLLSLVEEMLKQQYSDEKDAYQKRVDQITDEADKEKQALETQLQAIKDKIDLQKKALDQQKDERQHQEDLASKEKELADLRTKLTIQQLDNSEESKKKQLDLENQITDKTKDLDDFKYDYATTAQENELDSLQDKYEKEYKSKEDELDKETTAQKNYYQGLITQIESYTSKEVNIRTEAMNLINSRSQDLLNRLLEYNRVYGDGVESTVQKTFSDGYNSLVHFNNGQINILNTLNQLIDRMSSYKSQIQGVDSQISSLESQISDASRNLSSLQGQANDTAYALGSAANSAKKAENDAKRASLQAEIAKLNADDAAGRGYSGYISKKINQLQNQLDNLPSYAVGTDNAPEGLSRVNENGLENIFQPDGKGNYVMLKQGAIVQKADETRNLTQWGKFNPATYALQSQRQLQSIASNAVTNNNSSPISIQMPINVYGTADESILNGLKAERTNIKSDVFNAIKSYRQSAGVKKSIYNY